MVVLAYPKFSETDYEWIQNYRKVNDILYYDIVDPHFTFVFPTYNLPKDNFIEEISSKCKNEKQIPFIIRSAVINKDSFIDTYHELLVPDKGHSSIIKLHDKLYSGKLFTELRLEIDFIPHIGIGNSKDPIICKNKVDKINKLNIEIKGIIDDLDIAIYENNKVETVEKVKLL
jgi:hypothetical protein